MRLDRKGAAFAFDHARAAQKLRHARAIERCRHDQDFQVFAQALLRIARESQTEIGIQRPFVKFIEQHGGDAGQFRIVQNEPRENAFGDDFDTRRARHFRAEADAQADRLADLFLQGRGHAFGGGPRREPARFQHDDLFALRPGFFR